MRSLILSLFALAFSSSVFAGPQDSIGTKVKNGKIFIIHKVDKGQGLYAISRRYSVALKDIIDANPGSDKQLILDQLVYVPTGKTAPMEQKVEKDYFKKDKTEPQNQVEKEARSTFAKYHKVIDGETLFAIAQEYKTKVDVIKSLNGLSSNELTIGQKLLVPMTKEEKESREKKEISINAEIDKIRDDKAVISKEIDKAEYMVTEERQVKEEFSIPDGEPIYQTKSEYIEEFDVHKVTERGIANRYVGSMLNQKKRLASHHTAEIGTTIMVTNPATKEAVFVKIVANHKLDKEKANVILLTDSAANRIHIGDNGIVEISFAK